MLDLDPDPKLWIHFSTQIHQIKHNNKSKTLVYKVTKPVFFALSNHFRCKMPIFVQKHNFFLTFHEATKPCLDPSFKEFTPFLTHHIQQQLFRALSFNVLLKLYYKIDTCLL